MRVAEISWLPYSVDPEIDFVIHDDPSAGELSGVAGMASAFGDSVTGWEGFRAEPEECPQLDEQRVLC